MRSNGVGLDGLPGHHLTPDVADRLATYGTDGTPFLSGVNGGAQTDIWAPSASLVIENADGGVVFATPLSAEVNATGAMVFGYTWGAEGSSNAPAAGTYKITFAIDDAVTINAVVPGAVNSPTVGSDWHSTSIWSMLPLAR